MTRSPSLAKPFLWSALTCALGGLVVMQFFGNAGRGYIDTASLFYWWGYQWVNPASETEHGWLILGLSAWLLWRNLRQAEGGLQAAHPAARASALRESPFPTAATIAMAGGLVLHALSFAAQQSRGSIIALLVFTWGVLRLAGGRRWGKAAMFPLGFMVFAIPISVLDEIGLPLRMWVTGAGERIAHFAGIHVLRSGTQLVAPDGRFHYDVAAPCSGVRSLMALTALSLLVGYLNFHSRRRRALVLILCFPLVYLGNVARIVAIVFAAQWGGPTWGERAHEVMGYGVFAIVLGGVLAFVAAIRRWWPEPALDGGGQMTDLRSQVPVAAGGRLEVGTETPDRVGGFGSAGNNPSRGKNLAGLLDRGGAKYAWAVAGIVGMLLVGEMFFLHALASAPQRGEVGVALTADGRNPVELPAFVGTEWIGQRSEISAVERDILPPDTGYSRKKYAFIADRRRDVFLSIVLSGRDRTSIHRPELCLVAQGWTIDEATHHTFRAPAAAEAGPGEVRATLLRVRREIPTPRGKVILPQLVVYWFVGGDTVVASHWKRFVYDAWNRVVHARADRWAYILMQTDAADGEAVALARMQTVLDGTLPAFQRSVSRP